jgi:hypothetical protein
MGKEKQTSSGTTVVNQTTTPTPTAEETALNQRNLRIAQATEPGETAAQTNSLNLINQLLTGTIPQGYFQDLGRGISPEAIASQGTQMMRAGRTGMQQQGLADSGVADRAIAKDISSNLLYPAEQFNIGALQNLLNLAFSGQAQVQQPVQANVNNLSSSLAGLRSMNTQGTTSTSSAQYGMNPFMKSFQTSLGSSLGSGSFGSAWKTN